MSTNGTYGVTNDEIMDYLKVNMVTREEFNKLDAKVSGLEKTMATKEDLGKLRSDIIDHIDKKILELKTDLVTLMRSEDRKLCALVELLVTKSLLTPVEASTIIRLEPFPRGV